MTVPSVSKSNVPALKEGWFFRAAHVPAMFLPLGQLHTPTYSHGKHRETFIDSMTDRCSELAHPKMKRLWLRKGNCETKAGRVRGLERHCRNVGRNNISNIEPRP